MTMNSKASEVEFLNETHDRCEPAYHNTTSSLGYGCCGLESLLFVSDNDTATDAFRSRDGRLVDGGDVR